MEGFSSLIGEHFAAPTYLWRGLWSRHLFSDDRSSSRATQTLRRRSGIGPHKWRDSCWNATSWRLRLTLKMSHDGSGRDSCSARGVTDPGVGSSALVGHKARRQKRGARTDGAHSESLPAAEQAFDLQVVASWVTGPDRWKSDVPRRAFERRQRCEADGPSIAVAASIAW